MHPLDEGYLARREKQIEEMFMLRATIWPCILTAVVLGVIAALLLNADNKLLGSILLVAALLFGAGSIFMTATYFGMKAADRAIQQERDQVLALYAQMVGKPKRSSPDAIGVPDDGELSLDADPDDRAVPRRSGR